jgi:predicted transcriptional regulator
MTSGWGDLLSLLERRADVLDELVGGPREKRDLVDALDVSRSTVDRAIRELEADDLIDRTCDGVAITFLGRVALSSHLRHRRGVATLERMRDVLQYLDPSAPLPLWVLEGADVHRPDPPAVHRPYETVRSDLAAAEEIQGLSKAITDPVGIERFREFVLEGGMEIEIVGTPGIVEHLLEHHPEDVARASDEGSLALYEHDDVPFGLFVCDPEAGNGTVLVFVYDDGQLAGVIRNRRLPVVEWAASLFRGVREAATPVAPR